MVLYQHLQQASLVNSWEFDSWKKKNNYLTTLTYLPYLLLFPTISKVSIKPPPVDT